MALVPSTPRCVLCPGGQIARLRGRTMFVACGGLDREAKSRCVLFLCLRGGVQSTGSPCAPYLLPASSVLDSCWPACGRRSALVPAAWLGMESRMNTDRAPRAEVGPVARHCRLHLHPCSSVTQGREAAHGGACVCPGLSLLFRLCYLYHPTNATPEGAQWQPPNLYSR
jgi:hypothetical protein